MNSTNTPDLITQELANRSKDRIGPKFTLEKTPGNCFSIFTSSSDEGVVRNGGRRGSCFAPLAILNAFKSFIAPKGTYLFQTEELCPKLGNTQITFEQSQENAKSIWLKYFAGHNQNGPVVHIGGGHDHIFPLLWAVDTLNLKLSIVNVDAHTDTRTDVWAHSGTPFRQFDQVAKNDFTLYQYGLHPYSNPESNHTPLVHGRMKLYWHESTQANSQTLSKKFFENCDIAVLSLDADALDGSVMGSVSAVNPNGFQKSEVDGMVDALCLSSARIKILGIYEYNPLYDNLTQAGQRYIASLIYRVFFGH